MVSSLISAGRREHTLRCLGSHLKDITPHTSTAQKDCESEKDLNKQEDIRHIYLVISVSTLGLFQVSKVLRCIFECFLYPNFSPRVMHTCRVTWPTGEKVEHVSPYGQIQQDSGINCSRSVRSLRERGGCFGTNAELQSQNNPLLVWTPLGHTFLPGHPTTRLCPCLMKLLAEVQAYSQRPNTNRE